MKSKQIFLTLHKGASEKLSKIMDVYGYTKNEDFALAVIDEFYDWYYTTQRSVYWEPLTMLKWNATATDIERQSFVIPPPLDKLDQLVKDMGIKHSHALYNAVLRWCKQRKMSLLELDASLTTPQTTRTISLPPKLYARYEQLLTSTSSSDLHLRAIIQWATERGKIGPHGVFPYVLSVDAQGAVDVSVRLSQQENQMMMLWSDFDHVTLKTVLYNALVKFLENPPEHQGDPPP